MRPAVVAAVLSAFCAPLGAQSGGNAGEDSIKAAFLFKFCGYVDWPAESFTEDDSPFVIGVLGAEQIAADLAGMITDRVINGRSVEVRTLRSGEPPAGVHILFVGRAENDSLAAIFQSAAGLPVLIVTETDDVRSGSAINFVIVNNKVRFDVMLASAETRNLRISARLLRVARNVVNGSS